MKFLKLSFCFLWVLIPFIGIAEAKDAELAQKMANPVASIISLPVQFNYSQNYGPNDEGDKLTTNVQPVIPVKLNDDWNMINRVILPVVSQNKTPLPNSNDFGLSDTVYSMFFSPNKPGLIWGVGPAFLIPTATKNTLGLERWGVGPTGVVLKQQGQWTFGGLANHIWDFAGNSDRGHVNSTFMQPFINYTTKKALNIFLNTEATYDWVGEEWSVPINAGVNQLMSIGSQAVQLGGGLVWWADSPPNGPEGLGFRVNVVFIFPT